MDGEGEVDGGGGTSSETTDWTDEDLNLLLP